MNDDPALATSIVTSSPVKEATWVCLQSFDNTIRDGLNTVGTKIQDNVARLRVWAGNLGAYHDVSSSKSADFKLRNAPEAVSRIRELLEEICSYNDELRVHVTGNNGNITDCGLGEERSAITEIVFGIEDCITSLFKVSALLRSSTSRDRYSRAAVSLDNSLPQQFIEYDRRHVVEKFPRLRDQRWLADRLANAITLKRRFLRYAQSHYDKISREPESWNAMSSLADTAASTLQPEMLAKMNMNGSDLGDHEDTHSNATSRVSAGTIAGDPYRAHVRKLDRMTKDHAPFLCPYCRGMVHFKDERKWRKHVFSDLKAYACTFEHCHAGLFQDRSEWFNHELDYHRRFWVCFNCTQGPFSNRDSFQRHLTSIHGHQDSDMVSAMANASSRPVTQILADACPLCEDWYESLRAKVMDQNAASEVGLTVPLHEFKQHLGNHQEQLALFAVPTEVEESNETYHSSEGTGVSPTQSIQSDIRTTNDIDARPRLVAKDHPGRQDDFDPADLIDKARYQLEYYFSVDNLVKDTFLRRHMDSQGFVDLDVVANFNRIKQLTQDRDLLRTACRRTTIVEIRLGEDGTELLRRTNGWDDFTLPIEQREASAQARVPVQLSSQKRADIQTRFDTPRPYVCKEPGCSRQGEGFSTLKEFQRHESVHHMDMEMPKTSGFICQACSAPPSGASPQWWSRLEKFKAHIERKHKGWSAEELVRNSAALRPQDVTSDYDSEQMMIHSSEESKYSPHGALQDGADGQLATTGNAAADLAPKGERPYPWTSERFRPQMYSRETIHSRREQPEDSDETGTRYRTPEPELEPELWYSCPHGRPRNYSQSFCPDCNPVDDNDPEDDLTSPSATASPARRRLTSIHPPMITLSPPRLGTGDGFVSSTTSYNPDAMTEQMPYLGTTDTEGLRDPPQLGQRQQEDDQAD